MSEAVVAEKAVSQQQQKFMGMVHAMQKGKKVKGASPELKKAAQSMSKKAARDYASTKHAGLPKKVSETEFKQQLRNLLEADGVKVSDAILEAGWRDFVNRGKKALGTAALAGTMALGAAGADARVGADHDPNINRLTGKPMSSQQAEPAGTSQAAPNVAKFAPVERVNRTDSGIWIQHKGHEYKVHKEVSKDAPYPKSAQKASVTDAQLGFRGIGIHTVVLYPFDDELGYAPAILYSK